MIHILLIEDDEATAHHTALWLYRAFPGSVVHLAASYEQAVSAITAGDRWQLIVSDYDLGMGRTGGDVLRFILDTAPELAERFVFFAASIEIRQWRAWIDKGLGTYEDFERKAQHVHKQGNALATDETKLTRCGGCRDNFYNGKNPLNAKRCWSFKDAKQVIRWRLGTWSTPVTPGAFLEVETNDCHRGDGYHHYEKLPPHAIDPIRLRIVGGVL